jgi:hypothetical protein
MNIYTNRINFLVSSFSVTYFLGSAFQPTEPRYFNSTLALLKK